MTHIVLRTCTEIREEDSRHPSEGSSLPLEDFREKDAYVLLGAPGAGKTTSFEKEKAECPGGHCVTARDFTTLDGNMPEWRDKTLFVDGLDETRAGSTDGRTPLDNIRANLDRLGRPRFRLSCREADWFGANDRDHLKTVSRDGSITVLRLDPLSGDDIREILRMQSGIGDPDTFIAKASEKGIDGLLANPQSLGMLAAAVTGGVWPETRMGTFELSCRTLFYEHNNEHQIAKLGSVDISHLMNAAGRLCTVQLLTGATGYTPTGDGSEQGYPGLEKITGENREIFCDVLGTKLFEAPSEGRVTPVHRQIAEFLAARYLAVLIESGLPVTRVLAMMTGHDGVVVSELRGLSAWLAAHSKPSRAEIIARDPIGTVLYGDVREFSTDEKRQVLECLEREAKRNPWFVGGIRMDSRLGDIVTPDMEKEFRKILDHPARDDARQSFVLILIEMLVHGKPLPGLADLMSKIVRDEKWKQGVKHSALEALVGRRENGQPATAPLVALLADVNAGLISDPDDDLLGSLLIELYPAKLSVTEVLQYLRTPKKASHFGRYHLFWIGRAPENSTSDQLAELLDALVARYGQPRVEVQTHPQPDRLLRRVPLVVLSRFLKTSKEEVELNRLFDWLGAAAWVGDWDHDIGIGAQEAGQIAHWLRSRPALCKSLIELGLKRCVDSAECTTVSEFNRCMFMEEQRRLFGFARPPDFGSWCLDQAIAAEDRNAAIWLMGRVAEAVYHHLFDKGLSREVVERRIAEHVVLKKAFIEMLRQLEESRGLDREHRETQETQENQLQRQWCDRVTPHEAELRENRGQPALLYDLAKVYLGGFVDVPGKIPQDRLRNLLDDDYLIEAVLDGFRGSIRRSDVPSADEIIRLGVRNQTHHLALPIVAGLEETVRIQPNIPLDEMQIRLALAIHYTVPLWPLYTGSNAPPADRPPSWFPLLLKSHPHVVADVLIRSARSKLHNGMNSAAGLYELAHSPDHAEVARLASLPLLKAFPVRCTERQLLSLSILLHAALLHCEKTSFLELMNRKLAHRSMNVAQRVYWLAAGLLVSPHTYLEKLESYVARSQRRVWRLAEVIATIYDVPRELIQRMDIPALKLLIRLIGSSCRPFTFSSDPDGSDSEKGGIVTPAMETGFRILEFINRLALMPSLAVTEALESLSADDNLLHWRSQLIDAAYRQNTIRREAEFHHCDVGQVLQVLDNRRPTNAADLAALTTEYLHKISGNIRDGNTSDWRQYWNVDPHNRAQNPKPEDACRDALLSDLQNGLKQLGIDAQPEGHYANNKRSDIRVSYGGFNVPVEIKKSDHRNLWSAIKRQLIAKYTRDPNANGFGIYLVFWFGEAYFQSPESGLRPKSAAELEQRLRDTLSAHEKLKISICVIDVAKPEI